MNKYFTKNIINLIKIIKNNNYFISKMLYMLNNSQKKELNTIVNKLYMSEFFNEKRFKWLKDYINNREIYCTCQTALYVNLLQIISQREDDYGRDYLIEINEYISEYSSEDIQYFIENINNLANCKVNPLTKEKFYWLMTNIHQMPYNKDYFSFIENREMPDFREQGMDRIYSYHKDGDRWNEIMYDE